MPEPRFTLDALQFSTRQFVDRKECIGAFEDALRYYPEDKCNVLVYYGVGGIGKTRLRRELSAVLDNKYPHIPHALVDFNIQSHRSVEPALTILAWQLNKKYKILFPYYTLAFDIYWNKVHPQIARNKKGTDLPFADEVDAAVNVADLSGLFESIPYVAIIPNLLKVLYKLGKKGKEWWDHRGMKQFHKLQDLEPVRIEELFPAFWAQDIKEWAIDNVGIVIFFDTYEALREHNQDHTSSYLWLRELISHLPQVLWVICGREKLCWAEYDPQWKPALEQRAIENLPKDDAKHFLNLCGIYDENVRDAIIEGSEEIPFYLDLAADTYFKIKKQNERDPMPNDFAPIRNQVIHNFVTHLEPGERETIKLCSAPRFGNYTIFANLVRQFATGYSTSRYSEFLGFSFIKERDTSGAWDMHPLMRKGLQESLLTEAPEFYHQVHSFMFNFYNDQLLDLHANAINENRATAIVEAFYHGKIVMQIGDFFEWFIRKSSIFITAARWDTLIPLYNEILDTLENNLGANHPAVATTLNNLAGLYRSKGKYKAAEPLYQRSLAIRENTIGPDHPDVATTLNDLAILYRNQGKYVAAEPLFQQSLAIREKALGPDHSDVANTINNLALLYTYQGKYEAAKPLYQRSLAIREKVLGPDHLEVAITLNNLALLHKSQGKYEAAEPLYQRSLVIREKALGPDHPDVATTLSNLAILYRNQGKYEAAEPLYHRSLAIREKALGPDHPDVATALNNLAILYRNQGKYEAAEPLYQRSLVIKERALGPGHPDVATILNNLALLYHNQGKYEAADPLYKRDLAISGKALGPDHPHMANTINNLALLYTNQGKYEAAELLFHQALAIRERTQGPDHPNVANTINNLAGLYTDQGKYDAAEPLFQQALAIREKALGRDHPDVANTINNLALLYMNQSKFDAAEHLFQRALTIREKVLGPNHPDVAATLHNLAELYHSQGKCEAAEQLHQRVQAIQQKHTRSEHD